MISDNVDIEKFCIAEIGGSFSLSRIPVSSSFELYEKISSRTFCVIVDYSGFSQVDLVYLFGFIDTVKGSPFVLLAYGHFVHIKSADDLFAWNSMPGSWSQVLLSIGKNAGADFTSRGEIEVNACTEDRLLNQIDSAARGNSNVLILGPSGCGKTYTARKIYSMSPRKNKAFISVNAAEFNPNLIESELFGCTKGAYTGSNERNGLFAAADGGTLFIDEIAELPANVQAKLLRVLETKSYYKVGSFEENKFDCKMIFATNAPLPLYIRDQKFRFDLFQRISTITICLEPLKNNKEKIVSLSETFARRHGKSLTPAALKKILSYQWPGNIRELKNVIDRASAFCQDEQKEIDCEQILFMNIFPE